MNDLEELFNRQPPYSDADLTKIIHHFREVRAQYLNGAKPKKSVGAKSEAVDLAAIGLGGPAKPETEDFSL